MVVMSLKTIEQERDYRHLPPETPNFFAETQRNTNNPVISPEGLRPKKGILHFIMYSGRKKVTPFKLKLPPLPTWK